MKILYLPHEYSQQRQREKKRFIYPVRLAAEATYYKNHGHYVRFDYPSARENMYDRIIREPEGIPFLDLPIPERIFTDAFNEKYQHNGNFKYTPGTYILSTSGCWYGSCKFCVERKERYKRRDVASVINELLYLKELGFKEVFDDSGTFPTGLWLNKFCREKIAFGLAGLPFSCNMRIGADVDFKLMKDAGFRMLLYGIESVNQHTLDKLKKGVVSKTIVPTIKQAKAAGLSPHIAIMVGYPWETEKDEARTLSAVHDLLKRGYADTAQASIYNVSHETPRPGAEQTVDRIYDVAWSPRFWFHKLKSLRSIDDLKYLVKQIKAGIRRG